MVVLIDRLLTISTSYEYDEIYVYDVDGTWTNNTDGFEFNGTTYTVSSQTSGPYGYVRSYSGTDLYIIKGVGSADFAGSDTFQDNPKRRWWNSWHSNCQFCCCCCYSV